jgi:EAL domain-containing protein (putative c-di-GMP-specific phosphodiesterase class I)
MYRAKERGRNTYQFYTADMNAKAGERLALETQLRHALERGELLLHYQPQVDLQSGRIIGVEALVRWQRPESGMVSPADFIPMAEETGLIVPIGEWVLRTACAQGKAWQSAGVTGVPVSVNVSARQFRHKEFTETVRAALRDTGLRPDLLELEITESLAMEHAKTTIERLDELHAMGVRLSIDDFGTGYSSLSYLTRFPIHTLKIDRAFINNVTTDRAHSAIASAIILLAHNLNLRVVAEGVETEAQAAFLRTHRCDAMQGYLFSRPVAEPDMTSMLARGRRWAPITPP